MSNLCADIAKDFVDQHTKYDAGNVGSFIESPLVWSDRFQKCKDFPKSPVVIETEVYYGEDMTVYHPPKNASRLVGKNWRAVFTEIIE